MQGSNTSAIRLTRVCFWMKAVDGSMLDCSSVLVFSQDLGEEQKEEDILITLEDLRDVTVYYFSNLSALDCQSICQ